MEAHPWWPAIVMGHANVASPQALFSKAGWVGAGDWPFSHFAGWSHWAIPFFSGCPAESGDSLA